jgi:hypothetical protein
MQLRMQLALIALRIARSMDACFFLLAAHMFSSILTVCGALSQKATASCPLQSTRIVAHNKVQQRHFSALSDCPLVGDPYVHQVRHVHGDLHCPRANMTEVAPGSISFAQQVTCSGKVKRPRAQDYSWETRPVPRMSTASRMCWYVAAGSKRCTQSHYKECALQSVINYSPDVQPGPATLHIDLEDSMDANLLQHLPATTQFLQDVRIHLTTSYTCVSVGATNCPLDVALGMHGCMSCQAVDASAKTS